MVLGVVFILYLGGQIIIILRENSIRVYNVLFDAFYLLKYMYVYHSPPKRYAMSKMILLCRYTDRLSTYL